MGKKSRQLRASVKRSIRAMRGRPKSIFIVAIELPAPRRPDESVRAHQARFLEFLLENQRAINRRILRNPCAEMLTRESFASHAPRGAQAWDAVTVVSARG